MDKLLKRKKKVSRTSSLRKRQQVGPHPGSAPTPGLQVGPHPAPGLQVGPHPTPGLQVGPHPTPGLQVGPHPAPGLQVGPHPTPGLQVGPHPAPGLEALDHATSTPLALPFGVFHLVNDILTGHYQRPRPTPARPASHPRGMRMTNRAHEEEFPPPGYRPTPLNKLLVNALDLTAPASDALLKNRKNAWVQCAGHPGSFAPAGPHTIWKKRLMKENHETATYQALMSDLCREFIPKFHREVEYNGDIFIEIEDLLQHFTDPYIMDIKMGKRTFLESEVKNPALRKDLYEKMTKINPNEPTPEEHEQRAITKLRYMQFREQCSSTSQLGFRIEAVRMSGEAPVTDLKKIRHLEEVRWTMARFIEYREEVRIKLLRRFKDMRAKFEASKFFKCHELIGSSLLILHDHHHHAGAWMIDFAKTLFIDDHTLSHRAEWEVGNHEDGYLTALDSLIMMFDGLELEEMAKEDPRFVANMDSCQDEEILIKDSLPEKLASDDVLMDPHKDCNQLVSVPPCSLNQDAVTEHCTEDAVHMDGHT